MQTRFMMQKLFRVAPGAFRLPSKVDSAVVRRAFSARRKTLRNALLLAAGDFAALGIDPGLRPENLSPQDYVRVARRTIGNSD